MTTSLPTPKGQIRTVGRDGRKLRSVEERASGIFSKAVTDLLKEGATRRLALRYAREQWNVDRPADANGKTRKLQVRRSRTKKVDLEAYRDERALAEMKADLWRKRREKYKEKQRAQQEKEDRGDNGHLKVVKTTAFKKKKKQKKKEEGETDEKKKDPLYRKLATPQIPQTTPALSPSANDAMRFLARYLKKPSAAQRVFAESGAFSIEEALSSHLSSLALYRAVPPSEQHHVDAYVRQIAKLLKYVEFATPAQ